jgi:hypothetical protein
MLARIYDYLQPGERMRRVREAAAVFRQVLEAELPEGGDKGLGDQEPPD